jgi:hypothetical protein
VKSAIHFWFGRSAANCRSRRFGDGTFAAGDRLPVSRRGLLNSCDDDKYAGDLPRRVKCPGGRADSSAGFLFKSLNRWQRSAFGGERRSPDRRRRTCGGRRLLLRCRAGSCCMRCAGSRRGSLHSPGARDRRSRGVSDECTCHSTDRSQHDRARHRAQRGTSGAFLCSCLKREKRSCDQCAHKQFLHRAIPKAQHGTPECEITASKRCYCGGRRPIHFRCKKARDRFPRGLNYLDVENMPVICQTCQIFSGAPNALVLHQVKRRSYRQLIGWLRHPRDHRRDPEQTIVVVVHPVEVEPDDRLGERF